VANPFEEQCWSGKSTIAKYNVQKASHRKPHLFPCRCACGGNFCSLTVPLAERGRHRGSCQPDSQHGEARSKR
jgi:hypothetical protein